MPRRSFFLGLTLALSLVACGKTQLENGGASVGVAASAPQSASAAQSPQTPPASPAGKDIVQIWGTDYGMARSGDAGFYTADSPRFNGDSFLMFYDYNAGEQRYVCTASGCAHSGEGCGAYLPAAARVFVLGDALYCLYPQYPDPAKPQDAWTAAVERRALDGTAPQLVAATELRDLQYDSLYTDGDALYTLAGQETRVLARIDLATGAVTTQPWPASSSAQVLAAFERSFVTIEYAADVLSGPAVTLCRVNADDGALTTLHSWPTGEFGFLSATVQDGKLYYVNLTTREICAYDIAADAQSAVSSAFTQYGVPYEQDWSKMREEDKAFFETAQSVTYPAELWRASLADGYLFLDRADTLEETPVRTAVSLKTGETTPLALTLYSNAQERPMPVLAATPHGLLVIQEERTVAVSQIGDNGAPYNFDAKYPVYALIDTANFVSSTPNFRTIQPVPYGG